MDSKANRAAREFVAGCREAGRRGLVRCSSGNASLRLDAERFLVSASRSWLGDLCADQVCVCRVADGAALSGGRPSVEAGFHAGVLRNRPDVNVVLHFQTPFATLLACRRRRAPNFFVIPEIPFYIGPVAQVPWFRPGSPGLAAAVVAALLRHDMAVMRHHGQVTVARDFAHAIQNAEFFELACSIVARGGRSVTPLPARAVRALLAARAAAARAAV